MHHEKLNVDEDYMWRYKGRWHYADLPESSEYPTLQDKAHHFTTLIIVSD